MKSGPDPAGPGPDPGPGVRSGKFPNLKITGPDGLENYGSGSSLITANSLLMVVI